MRRSHRREKLVLLLVLLPLSVGAAQDKVRLGVWNIEKLSQTAARGFPELLGSQALGPRSDSELDQMAEYLRDELQVDALMVTEIEADSPASTTEVPQSAQLNHVAQRMGSNWKYFLGRTGGKLRLGLLFNTDRIRLKKLVNLHAAEFRVTGRDVLDRDPFIAWVSVIDDAGQTRNDVLLVCVHLKSIQGRFRNNRMAAIAKLMGDLTDTATRAALQLPSKNEEREILILGDCNDSSFDDSGFRFMFDYLAGTGFTHLVPDSPGYPDTRVNGSKIDHIFATSKIVNDTMVADSFRVHTVPDSERAAYRQTFSDHFPVTVDLHVRSDDDRTLHEALRVADDAERGALLAEMTEEIETLAATETAVSDDEETAVSDDEEEEAGPPVIRFDVRDQDFERILAPQPRRGFNLNATEDLHQPPSAIRGAEEPSFETPATDSHTPLWTAIELIQDELSAIVNQAGGVSDEDLQRVRHLLRAERELLKMVRPGE